jgi:hypothetical protein
MAQKKEKRKGRSMLLHETPLLDALSKLLFSPAFSRLSRMLAHVPDKPFYHLSLSGGFPGVVTLRL